MATYSLIADLPLLEQISKGNTYGILYDGDFCNQYDEIIVHGKVFTMLNVLEGTFKHLDGIINCITGRLDTPHKLYVFAFKEVESYKTHKDGEIKIVSQLERHEITQELREHLNGLFESGVNGSLLSKHFGLDRGYLWYVANKPGNTIPLNLYETIMKLDLKDLNTFCHNTPFCDTELTPELYEELHNTIKKINSHGISNMKLSGMLGEVSSFISAIKLKKRKRIAKTQIEKINEILKSLEESQ